MAHLWKFAGLHLFLMKQQWGGGIFFLLQLLSKPNWSPNRGSRKKRGSICQVLKGATFVYMDPVIDSIDTWFSWNTSGRSDQNYTLWLLWVGKTAGGVELRFFFRLIMTDAANRETKSTNRFTRFRLITNWKPITSVRAFLSQAQSN